MRAPCRGCPDRHPLCYMDCPKYLEFRAERDRMNMERQAMNESFTNDEKAKAWRKKLNVYKKYH